MADRRFQGPDDNRIGTAAALVALVGHAAVILAVLLMAGPETLTPVLPDSVPVLLVSGQPGGVAPRASDAARRASAAPQAAHLDAAPEDPVSSSERLDQLTAPDNPANGPKALLPTQSANATRQSSYGAPRQGGRSGSGTSQADQGLGQGEGAEGIDLYAAASLPSVGPRPALPPAGDLWRKVAPCWRAASPRRAVLMVELNGEGALAGAPQAVRKTSIASDPQTLLAERAAFRALQACAPYPGLASRRWRVEFPQSN